MKLATILLIPDVIIEGSEFDRLNNMFPQAACHDGINKAFPLILADSVNPIIVNDMVDDDGEKLTGDALLTEVAQVLFADDRTRPIQISYGDLQALYEHPTYQLFAGNFKTLEDLEEVYKAVFGVDLVAVDLDAGKVKARADIKAYFLG